MAACSLFLTIFIGSMVIGIVYGIVSSFVMKHLNLAKHPTNHDQVEVKPPPKAEGSWGFIKETPKPAEVVEADPPDERFIEAALCFTFPWAGK